MKAIQTQVMQRRSSPSILLYSFGLALTLSLVFNGFLLYQQSRHLPSSEYEFANPAHSIDRAVWQQQLSDCQRANFLKDSLIRRLEPVPNAPPGQLATTQHTPTK